MSERTSELAWAIEQRAAIEPTLLALYDYAAGLSEPPQDVYEHILDDPIASVKWAARRRSDERHRRITARCDGVAGMER
jgi:hypothetical protein